MTYRYMLKKYKVQPRKTKPNPLQVARSGLSIAHWTFFPEFTLINYHPSLSPSVPTNQLIPLSYSLIWRGTISGWSRIWHHYIIQMRRFKHKGVKQWYLYLLNPGEKRERENLVTNIIAWKENLKTEVSSWGRRKVESKNVTKFYHTQVLSL